MGRALSSAAVWITLAVSAAAAPPVYDVAVIEATPAGIALAVRAAREGLKVALTNHTPHLGGILSSGLGVWDSEYEGRRSPIYDAVRQAIFDHYRAAYGVDSAQYRDALPGRSGHTNGKFEPRVAEAILTHLVLRERNITIFTGYYPVAVERHGRTLAAVRVRRMDGSGAIWLRSRIFADCTYEGDLLPIAGAAYRLGRESRREYGEPHAGVIYMAPVREPPDEAVAHDLAERRKLRLRPFSGLQRILPESTGQADSSVQAFNYRTILSSNPADRLPVTRPADYDPVALRRLDPKSVVEPLPNEKICWNRPQLLGAGTAYITGDWTARRRIMDRFWDATLGLLYFLQNDPSVPPALRAHWRRYGVARDEFTDGGHRPYEIYVREGRRLVGRTIVTERNLTLGEGLERAPIAADSIAFTDWYMDCHGCTERKIPGNLEEGKMMLEVETFPGQVPYRALLPKDLDNLLVPVALSASHVAWGAIRLEPAWMEIGEAAGWAASLAIQRGISPAQLPSDLLVRRLAAGHFALGFFNDVDPAATDPMVAAAEYFSTKGFFPGYDAGLGRSLDRATARIWASGMTRLLAGVLDANALARQVEESEASPPELIDAAQFAALLARRPLPAADTSPPLTRGLALRMMWSRLP